jgi:hypothetical protein
MGGREFQKQNSREMFAPTSKALCSTSSELLRGPGVAEGENQGIGVIGLGLSRTTALQPS